MTISKSTFKKKTYCLNKYLTSDSQDVGLIMSPPSAAPRGGSDIITSINKVHSTPSIGVTYTLQD